METTSDAFLGGRLQVLQPKQGYRAGVDPVFLAASCPAKPGDDVLELGCGVGVASLCLGARVPGVQLHGVEIMAAYADLAQQNATRNGLEMQVQVGDVAQRPTPFYDQQFHHVILNPPYFVGGAGTVSPDMARASGRTQNTELGDWIDMAARRLRPKGIMTLIQRVERLPDILGALEGRLGSVQVQPLAPRHGQPAHLILVQACKSGRAPFQLLAPIVLHQGSAHTRDGEPYAPDIENVLRHGAALTWANLR